MDKRYKTVGLAAVCFVTLAVTAFAAPSPARRAETWQTRLFSVSYDGDGSFSYSAQGANGDTGCFMSVGEGARYSFDQLWTVRMRFKRAGRGKYATDVVAIHHVTGPQVDKHGASHLKGQQTKLHDENCADGTIVPNTGTFDCTSSTVTLTSFPNPQMNVGRDGKYMVLEGRAFLDGHWKYTGTDTIPGDKKGCATYQDDMTYGSDLIPGIYDTTRVLLPVAQLAGLARRKSVTKEVALDRNTEFPRQKTCDAVFGPPHVCVIHRQKLSAIFKVIRVR